MSKFTMSAERMGEMMFDVAWNTVVGKAGQELVVERARCALYGVLITLIEMNGGELREGMWKGAESKARSWLSSAAPGVGELKTILSLCGRIPWGEEWKFGKSARAFAFKGEESGSICIMLGSQWGPCELSVSELEPNRLLNSLDAAGYAAYPVAL